MSGAKNRKMMPLEGVRVLEYAIYHAGPGCGAILGDLGADVIKIETGKGDPERGWKGVDGNVQFVLPNDESLMFHVSNRNKRGVCLDVGKEKGRAAFLKLIEKTDVFLTNLRHDTKLKLGLDYRTLSGVNPRLIHANVTGYGPEGPLKNLGAYDPAGQARSGMMYALGSREPTLIHLAVLDQATAIAASHAILTALFVRERRGIGQEVHASLFSTALWLLQPNLTVAGVLGVDPGLPWDRTKNSPLRNCFRCKGGDWIMGVHHPEKNYWAIFCEATGLTRLLDDARFSTPEGRQEHCAELVAIFDEVFETKTREEWIDILQARQMMFSPVQNIYEVLNDVQALANRYLVEAELGGIGKVKIPGYPIHFSACSAGARSMGPAIGEHTDGILKELGYSEAEIAAVKEEAAS